MRIDLLILLPYYLCLLIRNFFYDKGVFKSYSFDTPIITVGNITVGGTGKTPQIEYLINLFKDDYRIAVISRGYGRKTKGYIEVLSKSKASEVGDEPLQIKRKYQDVMVIVDENRVNAINKLEALDKNSRPQLILLDDAFQYRRVKPLVSILLVNCHRPIFRDFLLPFGRLRDLVSQTKRADLVVVTKFLSPIINSKQWRDDLKLKINQKLFFSTVEYKGLKPVFTEEFDNRYLVAKSVILFSGIADNSILRSFVSANYSLVENINFADHHSFSKGELKRIASLAKKNNSAVLVCTEKDAQRLINQDNIPDIIKLRLSYIPIEQVIIEPLGEENHPDFKKTIEEIITNKE